MKSTLYISGLLFFFIIGCVVEECTHKPFPEPQEERKDSIKGKIIEKEKEVVKWKKAKDKIIYVTEFDTLVTKETIYIELIKCDSVVKISDSIIVAQDTIIADQKEVIAIVESQNTTLKRDIKKQKRKLLLTKIGAGVVIVVSILLAK